MTRHGRLPIDAVSPLKLFLIEFGENRVAVIALVVLGLIILLAVAAPLITPQNPYDLAKLVLTDARRPPGYVGSNGFTHWLGTDAQGRDLLLGHRVRPAHLDSGRPDGGRDRLHAWRDAGNAGGLRRRAHRDADHAHHRSAVVVSRHPAGLGARRAARARGSGN